MATAALNLPTDIRLMNAVSTVLFALVAAGLALAGISAVSRSPKLDVSEVVVEGDVQRSSARSIRTHAVPHLAGSYFSVDLAEAQQAFEAVPWVRRARVSRVWPDRLVAHLQEHRAAALWRGTDGVERLVNTYGEVFDANLGDVDDDALPVLVGPQGSSAAMLTLWVRLQAIVAPLQARVEQLNLSGRGSWRMGLDTGAVVELGRGTDDEIAARTERFVRTLPQLTARYDRPLVSADLRHRDGYAVRLKGVVTLPDTPPGTPPNVRR